MLLSRTSEILFLRADAAVMFSVSGAVYRKVHAQRGQEVYETEDNIFTSNEVRLFRPPRELPLHFLRWGNRHAILRLQSPVNCSGKHDFRYPSSEPVVEEEEETMRMS